MATVPRYKSEIVEPKVGLEFHGCSRIKENGSKNIIDHKVVEVVTFSFPLSLIFSVSNPPIE